MSVTCCNSFTCNHLELLSSSAQYTFATFLRQQSPKMPLFLRWVLNFPSDKLLQFMPKIFDWVQVWGFKGCCPPVNTFLMIEFSCNLQTMFWVIVLDKTMVIWIYILNEQKMCWSQNRYKGAFISPSKMHKPASPRWLMPTQTWNLSGCFSFGL